MRAFQVDGRILEDETYRSNLVRQFTKIAGETFIDLGSNEGYESLAMARQGAQSVLSIDARPAYVELTNRRAAEKGFKNVEAAVKDVRVIDELGLGKFDNVLCFGLVYHMTNPFNLLRRIRNICGRNFFLETHVAPLTKKGLLPKHERGLTNRLIDVPLEGKSYQGRVWLSEVPDLLKVTGSIDSTKTFWVTADALKQMLNDAGFEIKEFIYDSISARYEPWASLTNLGLANTKIFAYCQVKDGKSIIPVHGVSQPVLPIAFNDRVINVMRKISNQLKEWLGWRELKKKLGLATPPTVTR